ncbi:MAG: hypothetical protein HYU28_03970 [Actinobacteria bacterium]|nr:hypothetical protein [Actinomycetota bacterium]
MSSFWRVWVRTEADRLEDELAFIEDPDDPIRDAITETIEIARNAARGRSDVSSWWSGSDIENAWRAIHRGQEHLLLVAPPARVRALAPEIAAAVDATFAKDDPRRRKYSARLKHLSAHEGLDQFEREQARTMWRAAHEASDVAYANLRSYRNLLLVMTGLLLMALAGITYLQDRAPDTLALCAVAEPTTTTTTTTTTTRPGTTAPTRKAPPKARALRTNCPTGEKVRATTADALAVQAVGALGALLAAAVALSRQRRFQTPYGVPLAQVYLKIAAGATTALFGVVLLQNEVFGITAPGSGQAILGYAALFGYAQQAATRWVDSQARQLLGTATTKADPSRALIGGDAEDDDSP